MNPTASIIAIRDEDTNEFEIKVNGEVWAAQQSSSLPALGEIVTQLALEGFHVTVDVID